MRHFLSICLAVATSAVIAQDTELQPGLAVTYQSGEATASTGLPNLWLQVPAGQSPSPFLPGGRFIAIFEGFVKIDLRGDYSFQVTGKGGVKLEVNNAVLLDLKGITGVGLAAITKTVRLNKGANSLKLTYASPSRGDAQLRLFWSERPDKPLPHEPIRNNRLFHNSTALLTQAILADKGREIFLENRCMRCHTSEGEGIPEMAMSGPSFATIGDRRHSAWMAKWILDPKAHRPSARMPKMLHGETAPADAQAIAAYLGSLHAPKKPAVKLLEAANEAAEEMVRALNCIGCHNLPGEPAAEGKLSLAHVNHKFPRGELAAFLRAPNAHFAWTRMPKFDLTQKEASNIAQWLCNKADEREPTDHLATEDDVKRGKMLVATMGCLNCHNHKQENKFKAPNLAALTMDKWMSGCLADTPNGKSPHFGFKSPERAALRAFAVGNRKSLHRHEPAEFARRQIRLLNCTACHGELEGFPHLDMIGEKLKPEWMQTILDGSLKQRPRPWLTHRMPAFPARAKDLAHGLAMGHGHSSRTPAEKGPINLQLVEEGRKLVGVDGGFSCVACHGVKQADPLQVFEAQGVNFARVGGRLQTDFYLRWMLDPLRVDPQSRMPDYFDEDARSVLVDVLEGDAKKQIEAIRQYLLQGNKMKLPVMQWLNLKMKKTNLLLAGALFLVLNLSAQAEGKWITLFDGKKVTGLRGYGQKGFPDGGWKVENGTIKTIPRGKGGKPRDLATDMSFVDFEFECEWKVAPGGNSGIMYRVLEQKKPAYATGPELQVLDDERHADGKINFPLRTAGSLYELLGKGMKDKPYNKAGEWNKVRIVFKDNNVQHWLNGAKIVEYTWGSDKIKALILKSKFKGWEGFMQQPKGRIVIQHHGQEVWYRAIRVRRL